MNNEVSVMYEAETAPVKLLLVDDVEANLIALEALIGRSDIEIYKALSGKEALELLLQYEFSLAILDVQMPEMDGFQLAEFMRSTERTKSVPIVFVSSAGTEKNYAFHGYESGAVDFLYKPLDIHAVKSKVNIFIDLYQQRKTLSQQLSALEKIHQEQNELLAELQKTQTELHHAIRMRDDFMSIVSHELRTPLNTLKLEAYVRRLLVERGNKEAFSLDKISTMIDSDERQIQRIVRLIDDMTDVSRIRTGKLCMRPKTCDMSKLVNEVIAQFAQQLATAGCNIIFEGEPAEGKWDDVRIEQVIANLLTNAMRYGANKPIEISVQKSLNGVNVKVRDNGIGIEKENLERIFLQFERISETDKLSRGLGLGLYISDQIVRMHGGHFNVDSTPGKGTTFTFYLPCETTLEETFLGDFPGTTNIQTHSPSLHSNP
jgi:signal transduction histidine kinase